MDIISMVVTNTTNVLSVNVSSSHSAQSTIATVEAITTSLDIGDTVEISVGYVGNISKVFSGYVKYIELKEPSLTYMITCSDVLVRAMDFFIASSDPNTPFTRQNITAEDLVGDVLELAGITDYEGDATSFTFAMTIPIEINLTSAYDYARFIADIIAFNLYADTDGTVHLERRLPYVVPGDVSVGSITDVDIISISHNTSDKDLRNRVVVYGSSGVFAEASEESPYLPTGFYKSVVVAAPQVFDNVGMAQQAADYNLALLNRLTETASISLVGNPLYFARQVVTITSAGTDVTGDWYVYAVTHSANSSGYYTSIELRR
jgi:hypothetical protein